MNTDTTINDNESQKPEAPQLAYEAPAVEELGRWETVTGSIEP